MKSNNHISENEKKDIVFYLTADGIWDIVIGLLLCIVSLALVRTSNGAFSIFVILLFSILVLLKRTITHPRIGYVEHQGFKDNIVKWTLISLIAFASIISLFLITKKTPDRFLNQATYGYILEITHIGIGMILSYLLFRIGKKHRILRFYYYSPLILVNIVAVNYIHWEYILPASFLLCGLVILFSGIFALRKFIEKYPRLEDM